MAEIKNTNADDVILYVMPHRIQNRRYDDMKRAAKKRKFTIVSDYCSEVTHVVTEFETREQAIRHLDIPDSIPEHLPEFLNTTWFSDSLRAKKLVDIQDSHRLSSFGSVEETRPVNTDVPSESRFPDWACQRSTPLKHHNHFLSSKLELLQRNHEFKDGSGDYSRALAFRRTSCVLKALPFKVTNTRQVQNMKDVGEHSIRVIGELLDGYCEEVHNIEISDWFKKMELFTGVFGCGPSTAKDWIDRGWSTVKEAQESRDRRKDWRLEWGLAFHDDLINPVQSEEARRFVKLIEVEAGKILPDVIVELTGGFRRGKTVGHDIDILFSHPVEGKEIGFLRKLLQVLENKQIILCGTQEPSTFHENVLTEDFKLSMRGQLDHFEKWIGICKLPKNPNSNDDTILPLGSGEKYTNNSITVDSLEDFEPKAKRRKYLSVGSPFELASSEHDWIARRVDLIISPYSQYYYALVGWTGSKQFNRDLRLYSQKVLSRKLTSHGLHDFKSGTNIPASSEKEVFNHLKVPYQEPENRNC